jgi:hypothetical protein
MDDELPTVGPSEPHEGYVGLQWEGLSALEVPMKDDLRRSASPKLR